MIVFIPLNFFILRNKGEWRVIIKIFNKVLFELPENIVSEDSEHKTEPEVAETAAVSQKPKEKDIEAVGVKSEGQKNINAGSSDSENAGKDGGPDIIHYIVNKMVLNSRFRSRFVNSCLNLLFRSRRLLKLKLHEVYVLFGWDDAADVGVFHGRVQALLPTLYSLYPDLKCNIVPSFTEERFDFDISGNLRIYPGRFLWVFLLFLFEFPLLSVYRLIRYVRKNSENI
ncbi:MAG: DUF2953 domain-containing protein [Fibrobacteres bacterium]|nr:DUF2953 domain-containing protein [Fibrobacterota bacterium]